MSVRAAIYTRVSLDQTLEGQAVHRQQDLCRERCEREGWTVVEVYEDNDTGASTLSKKPRPDYDRMLKDLQAGQFDVLVAYSNSRLTRRPKEWIDLINLVNAGKVKVATIAGGQYDLETAEGRALAITVAAWDAAEAERTGERLKVQKAQRAAQGKAQGGRYRVYGYDRAWNVIEEEAKVVKEAFKRRAAGESTTAIANDLSARGFRTVSGNEWRTSSLTKLLNKPGYAGKRLYNGQIIGSTDYPAIITETVYEKTQKALEAGAKGTNTKAHLFSNILICGKCTHQMVGNTSIDAYRCNQTHGGCGNTKVKRTWVEIPLVWTVVRLWSTTGDRDIDNTEEINTSVAVIDTRIGEIEQAHSDGDLELGSMIRLLKAERTKRKDLLASVRVRTSGIVGHSLKDFEALSLSAKRAVVTDYIDHVVILPRKTKGPGRFEPTRYEIHFSDGTVGDLGEWAPTLDEVIENSNSQYMARSWP